MRTLGVQPGRLVTNLAAAILSLLFLALAPQSATAQFVCGGSATGAEPQSGATSTAVAGSVACGIGVSASGTGSTALGTSYLFGGHTTASGEASIAIGASSDPVIQTTASGTNSIAVGNNAQALNSQAVAIGESTSARGDSGIAIGANASSGTGQQSVAIGSFAFINPGYDNSTAIGSSSNVNGSNTVVLGESASTGNTVSANSVAVGQNALVSGNNSTAIGQGAVATGASSTALGQGASATFANSTAIGVGAATTRANQVAVGSATNTYTLAGVSSAASLASQTGSVRVVTADAQGNLATANFSAQDITALQSNVGTLQQDVSVLQQQMKQAFEGTAIAIALGGASLPADKKFAISTNWGNFRGQNAVGVAAQYRLSNYAVANIGVSGGFAQGGIGSRAGVTFAW